MQINGIHFGRFVQAHNLLYSFSPYPSSPLSCPSFTWGEGKCVYFAHTDAPSLHCLFPFSYPGWPWPRCATQAGLQLVILLRLTPLIAACIFIILLQHVFQVFNSKTAELLSHHQVEIKQEFPREGYVF